MNKTLLIAKYEYSHHVFTKRFWITLLSMPIAIVLVMLLSMYMSISAINTDPVGYVDKAGLMTLDQEMPGKKGFFDFTIPFLAYPDEEAAKQAVGTGAIQGFYVIPEGYESTYQLTYVGNKAPVSDITSQFLSFVRENLLVNEKITNEARLMNGSSLTLQSLDGQQTIGENGWTRIIVPILVGAMYLIVVLSSGGYLMQALVSEKENRTMEIMLTSATPNELMTGKIVGNMAVGLTQLFFWILIAGIALLIFRDRIPFLGEIRVPVDMTLIGIGMMLLSFVLVSALMAAIGATVTDTQESQSVNGLVVLPTVLPFYFISAFMSNPNGVIARILSYFPMSAPLSMSFRMAFGQVPGWEIGLVFVILIVTCLLSVWLAGRAFKMGMLQYSRRIPLKNLFSKEARGE